MLNVWLLIAPCNLIIIIIIIKSEMQWNFMNGSNNTESSVVQTYCVWILYYVL